MALGRRAVAVRFTDRSSKKWRVALEEDAFQALVSRGGGAGGMQQGSLFSPLLFGKFFDPADAFPLWDFEADALVPLSGAAGRRVDWSATDDGYVLRAELTGNNKHPVDICVENGKVMEVSLQLRDCNKGDWRTGHWWEYGHVRRVELPPDANWKKAEAYFDSNDSILEIRIPKHSGGEPDSC